MGDVRSHSGQREPSGRRRLWPLLVLLFVASGCALLSQGRRAARLRSELDEYRFPERCAEVWPAALQVLADHGYQLVGKDREVVGQPSEGILERITGGGFSTSRSDHGFVLETMEDNSFRYRNNLRYRLQAADAGDGTCRVVFTEIQRIKDSLDTNEFRDTEMELELVRRIDPAAAARMDRAAGGVT